MSHWFEEYRNAYRQWWTLKASTMHEELAEQFEEFAEPDSLSPPDTAEIREIKKKFPNIHDDHLHFLQTYGVGDVRFPDHDEIYPSTFRFFDLQGIDARVRSIVQQVEYELEHLTDEYEPDECLECEKTLKEVLENPSRFLPIFGPSNVYDFYYAIQTGVRSGIVSHWYHDYHSCELLDGSADLESFTAFGRSLLSDAVSGDRYPL